MDTWVVMPKNGTLSGLRRCGPSGHTPTLSAHADLSASLVFVRTPIPHILFLLSYFL